MEGQVVRAHSFPVVGALVERVDIELRVARGVAQRFDDGVEIGLACAAAHGSDGSIRDVHAGVRRLQYGGCVEAAGIVSVKVNWNAELFAERTNELEGGVWLTQSGHGFDGEKMRAEFLELLRHGDVIL